MEFEINQRVLATKPLDRKTKKIGSLKRQPATVVGVAGFKSWLLVFDDTPSAERAISTSEIIPMPPEHWAFNRRPQIQLQETPDEPLDVPNPAWEVNERAAVETPADSTRIAETRPSTSPS